MDSGGHATTALGALRQERDRFVALAFCAADVLVELEADLTIGYAAGATVALTGQRPIELVGAPFLDLIVGQDRLLVQECLREAFRGGRLDIGLVHLRSDEGVAVPLSLVGYHLSDLGGRYFLALRLGGAEATREGEELGERNPVTSLFDRNSFAGVVRKRLAESTGDECRMTLLRLDNIEGLRGRLDDESRHEMEMTLSAYLRAASVDGDSAGQFDTEHYGLLHHAQTDIARLQYRLVSYTVSADPAGKGVTALPSSLDLDIGTMNDEDVAKALVYTINSYCDTSKDEPFTVGALSATLDGMMQTNVRRIGAFKTVIEKSTFDIAYQPIVDLQTLYPHHFEALVRFDDSHEIIKPYEFITFAEETGIICDFDIAMCQRILDWLTAVGREGYRYWVAVNLSGRSLGNPKFVNQLHTLLGRYPKVAPSVMFELTESAKIHDLQAVNKVIAGLRAAGHLVCLDDFGAGAAAFHYLRALNIDIVKIDGTYVRNAQKSVRGKAFLKAMAGLCHDLGIDTVGEMVENEETAQILRDCRIGFGQGYLFGRPSQHIEVFENAQFVRKRTVGGAQKPEMISVQVEPPKAPVGPKR